MLRSFTEPGKKNGEIPVYLIITPQRLNICKLYSPLSGQPILGLSAFST